MACLRRADERGAHSRPRMPVSGESATSSARLSRPLIAASGRAIVVWLAVAVIASTVRPQDTGGLMAVTLVAAVWLLSLRAATSSAPYALGPRVPAAIGAGTGLVCVAAANPLVPDLRLPASALLAMALGVFLSSATWDSVLERTARRRVLVIGNSAVERLLDMTDRRFRVAGLTSFYEHVFGCVPVSFMTSIWFVSLLHVRQRMWCRPGKRLFDVFAAGVGLVCAAPVMLLLALLVKRTSGPVIYRQTRVGEAGRRFTIYKLRSMGVTAERPGEPVYARQEDPRVTGVGRFMRRTHLDELPQLWNVLRGDMSMVGPRPERPEFVSMLEQEVPFWSRRLLMKPGMTGWAQVRCGYASDCVSSAEKLSYDFWYMRHNNLVVDLAVCVRTLALVLEILDPRGLWLRRRAASEDAVWWKRRSSA
jgi:lipopolysaccharide/colanic/teichoic acid biosynthesis glycosyltransferase